MKRSSDANGISSDYIYLGLAAPEPHRTGHRRCTGTGTAPVQNLKKIRTVGAPPVHRHSTDVSHRWYTGAFGKFSVCNLKYIYFCTCAPMLTLCKVLMMVEAQLKHLYA